MRFRKKPLIIEAFRWFTNGDHPADDCVWIQPKDTAEPPFKSEGKLVRYFRHPTIQGEIPCFKCDKTMHEHGWIDTLEGGHRVCPGDWIVTGVAGEHYPVKHAIFCATYEKVD